MSLGTETPSPERNLRVALIVLAALELAADLPALFTLFHDDDQQTALLRVAQALTKFNTALTPILATAALYFAIKDELRRAIVALAAVVLADNWVSRAAIAFHPRLRGRGRELHRPGAVRQDVRLSGDRIIAIVLARKNERLTLAPCWWRCRW